MVAVAVLTILWRQISGRRLPDIWRHRLRLLSDRLLPPEPRRRRFPHSIASYCIAGHQTRYPAIVFPIDSAGARIPDRAASSSTSIPDRPVPAFPVVTLRDATLRDAREVDSDHIYTATATISTQRQRPYLHSDSDHIYTATATTSTQRQRPHLHSDSDHIYTRPYLHSDSNHIYTSTQRPHTQPQRPHLHSDSDHIYTATATISNRP